MEEDCVCNVLQQCVCTVLHKLVVFPHYANWSAWRLHQFGDYISFAAAGNKRHFLGCANNMAVLRAAIGCILLMQSERNIDVDAWEDVADTTVTAAVRKHARSKDPIGLR